MNEKMGIHDKLKMKRKFSPYYIISLIFITASSMTFAVSSNWYWQFIPPSYTFDLIYSSACFLLGISCLIIDAVSNYFVYEDNIENEN